MNTDLLLCRLLRLLLSNHYPLFVKCNETERNETKRNIGQSSMSQRDRANDAVVYFCRNADDASVGNEEASKDSTADTIRKLEHSVGEMQENIQRIIKEQNDVTMVLREIMRQTHQQQQQHFQQQQHD